MIITQIEFPNVIHSGTSVENRTVAHATVEIYSSHMSLCQTALFSLLISLVTRGLVNITDINRKRCDNPSAIIVVLRYAPYQEYRLPITFMLTNT